MKGSSKEDECERSKAGAEVELVSTEEFAGDELMRLGEPAG